VEEDAGGEAAAGREAASSIREGDGKGDEEGGERGEEGRKGKQELICACMTAIKRH
jgi:hypothetical protein